MGGLALYGLGTLWIVAVAGPGTSWTALLPGYLVTGVGMGGVFAPMATEVLRYVPPQLAGAASGLNNTIRQVGSVLGSAAVGAILQNRLVHQQDYPHAFVHAMQAAMALPIAAAFVGALLCLTVKAYRPTDVAGPEPVATEVVAEAVQVA